MDTDPEHQVRIRIAWLYHIEGLTQAEIARRLRLNRIKVLRLLAACREEGVVQIRINSKLAPCVELERRLERAFGLAEAVVVPSPAHRDDTAAVVGHAAGHYLSDTLRDGETVAVGWGRTLQASLSAIARRPLRNLKVVSLLGGLTRAAALSPYEFAWRFADLFDAECYYVAAPAYTGDPATRDSLLAQAGLREVFAKAAGADLAAISVGDMSRNTTIVKLGLLSRRDLASLDKAGAVGDLLGVYLGADGRPLDHPVNRRVMAFAPARLKRIPKVILVSGGRGKAPILRAALALTGAKVLITDEAAAKLLVARGPVTRAAERGA
ncbi:MAG: sugar-binding transcriptional regulator [Pseudomonadota bacterium]